MSQEPEVYVVSPSVGIASTTLSEYLASPRAKERVRDWYRSNPNIAELHGYSSVTGDPLPGQLD